MGRVSGWGRDGAAEPDQWGTNKVAIQNKILRNVTYNPWYPCSFPCLGHKKYIKKYKWVSPTLLTLSLYFSFTIFSLLTCPYPFLR